MNIIHNALLKSLFLAAISFSSLFPINNLTEEKAVAVSDTLIAGERAVAVADTLIAAASTDSTSIEIPQEGRYDVMLDSVSGPLTYYNQNDIRWSNFLYGGKDPLSSYGCGPTVMAMLVTSLTGQQVLPTDMASWSYANNYWCPGQGSYHRLIKDSASAYGLKVTSIKDYTVKGIQDALNSGNLLVALMKKGHFTSQGHFLIITGMTNNGKIRIADSNNYENTKKEWDPVIILKELNHSSGSGGPLWMIGVSDTEQ